MNKWISKKGRTVEVDENGLEIMANKKPKEKVKQEPIEPTDTVRTVSGDYAKIEECRLIKGEYYKMNVDCIKVKNTADGIPKWYRSSHPNLKYDNNRAEWVDDRNTRLLEGIVGINEDGSFKSGLGSEWRNTYRRTKTPINGVDTVAAIVAFEKKIDIEEAKKFVYIDQANVIHDHTSPDVTSDFNTKGIVIKNESYCIVTDFNPTTGEKIYGWTKVLKPENVMIAFKNPNKANFAATEKIALALGLKEDIADGTFRVNPSGAYGARRNCDYLYDKKQYNRDMEESTNITCNNIPYTYGIEIETSAGLVPERVFHKYPFKCVRDGSLPEEGGEYISDVLRGDYGLSVTQDFLRELRKRCLINYQCSVHVHIGNVPLTEQFNVAIYSLGEKLQEELFSMFPYSRTDHQYNMKYKIKKNYCKMLKRLFNKPLVDKYLNSVGAEKDKYLTVMDDKVNEFSLMKVDDTGHETPPPDGWKCVYNRQSRKHCVSNKYNKGARYYFINLTNYIFSSMGTVEFRLHNGSMNNRKISNWIRICMAICWFAQKNITECINPDIPIQLSDIIRFSYNGTAANELIDYIEARKEKFTKLTDLDSRINAEESEYMKEEEEIPQQIVMNV